ncbi:quinol:cytochrome c oxidoreductase membrane protein 2 [Candidatus Sulfopaludibacter sp. SbA4]|nr:quinol:cytochrome c oxidoreductase membrane protein 2 [Candidatus Sulfopaludibacter sp. SbA4]
MTAQSLDFTISAELHADIQQARKRALALGVLGAILCASAFFLFGPFQFYRSYLWSYVFFVGVSVGSMAWLMLQYLTGGAWGVVIRRPCEAAARTLPLVALMFLPILIGIPNLYEWSHANKVAADPMLQHKHPYLNVPFFLFRTAVYFAGWLFLSWFFNRWSEREDREGPTVAHRKMSALAGPGLIFWGFSVTFMAVDWILSLNPHWFSTIFGLLFMAGQGLTSMAFLITLMVMLSRYRPMSGILTPRHLHDLGKFLLALVMIWAYFSFSQFLIIWAGNLPEEIPWYMERLNGGWQYVGLGLVVGHFALPFALLLSRDLKRNFKLLAAIALFILFMRFVDLYWLVAPDYAKGGLRVTFTDFAAPIGLGGFWLWYFLGQLEKRPLMPLNDPQLEGALHHGRE